LTTLHASAISNMLYGAAIRDRGSLERECTNTNLSKKIMQCSTKQANASLDTFTCR